MPFLVGVIVVNLGAMLVKMNADEQAGDDVSARRKALQEAIVQEIAKYGHPANNLKLNISGPEARNFGLFKNSINTKGEFSDLLAGRLDRSAATGYDDTNIADIVNYLGKIKDGVVELEDIQQYYKGALEIKTLGDLADIDGIAISADGLIKPMNSYCAGDVVTKMASLTEAIAQTDDERLKIKFRKQIEEMDRKIKRTPIENITFGMNDTWLPKKYIIEFLHENGYSNAQFGVKQEDGVDFRGKTRYSFTEDEDAPDGEFFISGFYGKPKEFDFQLQKYLNGGYARSNTTEKTEEYIERVNALEADFDTWIKQHLDADDLAEQYNLKFNGYVEPEYDSGPLDIDEFISGEITPHTYQAREVRRLADLGCGICGFGTGLGKSFTALAMCAYNQKHKITKKTCLVVPNSVLENWYHEARMFYNEGHMRSNVFFVGLEPKRYIDGNVEQKPLLDENGEPRIGKNGQPLMQDVITFTSKREDIFEQMWKIPQSNYSLVVMTKDNFAKIPLKDETKNAYAQDMVTRHLISDKDAENITGKKKSGYKQAKKVEKLEGDFSDEGTAKKDEFPYLEDMGFDSIITDESHFFKNSLKGGKATSGIQYVPNPTLADSAVDMSIKSDYIRRMNNGRGVYGLTATPVTNSPIEIYNMLSLVMDKSEFERRNIYTVDDFITTFGLVEMREQSKLSSDVDVKRTLIGFKNLDGLRSLFKKYVNIQTVEDVDTEIHVPDAIENLEAVEMNAAQSQIYEKLLYRATLLGGGVKGISARDLRKEAGFPENDSVFSIMRDMDKCTTDLDMYKRQITFILSRKYKAKLEAAIEKMPKSLTVTEENDETGKKEKKSIDVFCRLEDKGGDNISIVAHELLEDKVLAAIAKAGINESEINHPLSPKYAKLIVNLKKHLDIGGKQLVFTEEKSQHAKIGRILVHNLPIEAEQVGIINADDAKGDKLDKISKAYNSGAIKIVIANKKAEVGVNLQNGTTAIHHLTLPWTPASINQRNGRGVRQGNKVDSVDIYYYVGKGTFDSYRQKILKGKANWINALLMSSDTRAENADLETDAALAAKFAGREEEYNKAVAERELKRQNRKRETLINRLGQLASTVSVLNDIERRKQAEKDVLTEKIQKLEERVSIVKSNLNAYGQLALEQAEKKLEMAKEEARVKELEINAKYEQKGAVLLDKRKQIESILLQGKKAGELPFDESLIDHPENCIVSVNSEVFAVGDCVEDEKHNKIGRIKEIYDGGAIVLLINQLTEYEQSYKLSELRKFKKVSYSQAELNLNKLLNGSLKYSDLPTSGISKQQFMENIHNVKFANNDMVIGIDTDGGLHIDSGWNVNNFRWAYVFPEPADPDFRKKVIEHYAKKSNIMGLDAIELLKALLGNDFDKDIKIGGHRLTTKTELMEIIGKCWEKIAEKAYDSYPYPADRWDIKDWRDDFEIKLNNEVFDCWEDEESYETNQKEVEKLIYSFLSGISQEFGSRKEEEDRIAKAEIANKNRDRIKNGLDKWYKKFADIGLIMRLNMDEFETQYRQYPALGGIFLHDGKGFKGCLFKNKERLKSRFKAQFTDKWKEAEGAWWHMSTENDIASIYHALGGTEIDGIDGEKPARKLSDQELAIYKAIENPGIDEATLGELATEILSTLREQYEAREEGETRSSLLTAMSLKAVKILQKYKYPEDEIEEAMSNILDQACDIFM